MHKSKPKSSLRLKREKKCGKESFLSSALGEPPSTSTSTSTLCLCMLACRVCFYLKRAYYLRQQYIRRLTREEKFLQGTFTLEKEFIFDQLIVGQNYFLSQLEPILQTKFQLEPTNHISHVTNFGFSDRLNSSVELNLTLKTHYRIGSWWVVVVPSFWLHNHLTVTLV